MYRRCGAHMSCGSHLLPSPKSAVPCYISSFSLLLLSSLISGVPGVQSISSEINPGITFHQENEFADGRVHYAGRFIGDEATLPCEVNFDQCGQIYFLTWSKNISNEWQRVYLYSESYQTALGDFAVGDVSRVSLDTRVNMTAHGVAFLNIKSYDHADEGVYKCDVTYVSGTCPSLTYTKLFTLVNPGDPVLRVFDGRRNEYTASGNANRSIHDEEVLRVGPIDEGSMVVVECSTSGGRPQPDVKWLNGSHVLRNKISIAANPDSSTNVTSTAKFIISRYDLGSVLTCSVSNNATYQPLIRQVSFDVRVKPLTLKIRGPVTPVVAGEMVSLTCSVEGARPAASIDWFNRSELVDPQPLSVDEVTSDGTFRTSSTLVFIASRFDHDRDFSCMGTNPVLKERNEVPLLEVTRLKVLYPPVCQLRLLPKDRQNGYIRAECRASANPPVSSFRWIRDNQTLSQSLEDGNRLSEEGSLLTIPDSNLDAYACITSNIMGSSTCRLQAHQIQVFNSAGEQGSLPCEVDIPNCGKFSQISWSKNSSDPSSASHWLQIFSHSYHTPANPISVAHHDKYWIEVSNTSTHIFLKIKDISIEDEGSYKCDVAYVQSSCPSVTYVKFHVLAIPSKPVIRVNGQELHFHSGESSNISWPAFSFHGSAMGSRGEMTQVGPLHENSAVVLECSTSGGRPMPQVKWLNGSQELVSKTSLHMAESGGSRVTSIVHILLTRDDLSSMFSCQVSNNATTRPITRWIVFDVHVKPLRLHVRGPITPVNTGEVVSLTCIAEGARPPASVLWFNRSQVIHPQPLPSSDMLSDGSFRTSSTLTFSASRYDHEQELSCMGTNQVMKESGEAALVKPVALKVLFAPECKVHVRGKDPSGKTILTCEAAASPPVLNYTWIRGNKSVVEEKQKVGSHNDSTFLMTEEDAASHIQAYMCIATNAIGSSTPCFLQTNQLNAPSGWNVLRDENLIIVLAAAAGLTVFLIASSVTAVVCVVVRRKLKGLDVANYESDRPVNLYSRDVVNHKLKSENKNKENNKIAILDQDSRSKTEARSEYLTLCDTQRPSGPDVPLSPLKSPLIRSAYHTISLRLDGSPLLSDYGYTESGSPTSTSSSIQHFYERPAYADTSYADRSSSGQHQQPFHNSFQLLHNGGGGGGGPPSLPPLPPERRQIHLQNLYQRHQTLQHHHPAHHHHSHVHQQQQHHAAHSSSSHRHVSTPHQPVYHYSNPHHTVYRSLSRNRTASRSGYGDFHT